MLPQLELPEGPPSEGTQPFAVDLSTAADERPVSHRALQVFADYLYCVGIELSFYVSRKEQDRKSVSDEQSVVDEPPRSPAVLGEDYDDSFHLTTSSVVHAGTVHQSDYVGLCQLLQLTQVVNPKYVRLLLPLYVCMESSICYGVLHFVCVCRQGHHRGRTRALPALPALKYSKR